MRGVEQEAGDHTVRWDGLDRHGEPQSGPHIIKVLRTPGFQAEFVTQLGVSVSEPHHLWVGNHGGPSSIAVDSSGMYAAAEITETAPVLLKQSLDGNERLWTQGRGGVTHGRFQGGAALAADDQGMLFMLQQNGRLQPIDAESGQVQVNKYGRGGEWDPLPDPVKNNIDNRKEVRQRYHHSDEIAGADIAAHGDTLVISFQEQDSVRWLSKQDGSVETAVDVPAPLGVAVGPQEGVFAISDGRIVQVAEGGSTRPVVQANLSTPRRLDVDPESGDLLVAEGPPDHRVKRFDRNGDLKRSLGREGGRQQGDYRPNHFLQLTDITADGNGGFLVAEPYVAPRRVAHVDNDDDLANEWFGGLPYFGVGEPDTGDPSKVWLNPGSWFTLAEVDYDAGEWDVAETYHLDAMVDGLVQGPGGSRNRWMGLQHNGQTFLALYHSTPQVLRHGNGTLTPVTLTGGDTEKMAEVSGADATGTGREWNFKWLDTSADGTPQADEVSFDKGGFLGLTATDFDRVFQGSSRVDDDTFAAQLLEQPVSWTDGVPDWEFGGADVVASTEHDWNPSTNMNRGGGHAWRDPEGNYYAAYTARGSERHGSGWPSYWTGKFRMVKWDSDGNEEWKIGKNATVGGLGQDHGQTPPGQVHVPVGFIGETTAQNEPTVVLADRVESPAQAWTRDGLYAGSFFDRRADDGLPDSVYSWWRDQEENEAITTSDNASAGRVFETDDGRVFWYTQGRNSVPTYEITGWDDWERHQDSVMVSQPSHPAKEGSGLDAGYYTDTDLSGSPAAERTDAQVWFGQPKNNGGGAVLDGRNGDTMVNWAEGPEPLDAATEFGVRWTGEIEAQLSEAVTFLTYQRGGVRLWIDGEQRVFGWNEGLSSRSTDPIEVAAGERLPVQLDYYTTSSKPACSLMWESYTQERERIPTAFLYPESVEVATQPDARPATERIEAESCDVAEGFETNSGEEDPTGFIGNVIRGLRARGLGTPGAYVGYRRIDFGDGVSTLRARAKGGIGGSKTKEGKLDLRVDDPEGDSLGTITMQDKTTPYEEHTVDVDSVSGVHDVYVVNTSDFGNFHVSFDWFTFE
jgi:hypothetical protein